MTPTVLVVVGAFLASTVEMVEALTIVLAVGITRGWRSTLLGAAAAVATLAVLVAALGPALTESRSPRCGSWWVRSCSSSGSSGCARRSCAPAGIRARHDEDAIFAREVAGSRRRPAPPSPARLVRLHARRSKACSSRASRSCSSWSASAAPAATTGSPPPARPARSLVVGGVGVLVHRPLSRVPENSMKFVGRDHADLVRGVLRRRGRGHRLARARTSPSSA